MEYRNELGQTITDEQLDKMLEEIESGDFSNFEPVRNTAYGTIESRKLNEKENLGKKRKTKEKKEN